MKISALLLRAGLLFVGSFGVLRSAEAPLQKNGYTVTIELKVDEEGNPESVALLKSEDVSADGVLEKMAIAMALKTKFPPHLKDGKPVKATVRAPFFFPIEDDEGEAADHAPKPKVKEAIQPVYPLAFREKGIVGGAILELVVDAQGKLKRLTTLRASHPEFAAAATESLQKWTFTPAQLNGVPVESRTRFAVTYDTEQDMADMVWRIAPRPRLGSIIVIRPDHPIEEEAAVGTPATPGATASPAAPAGPAK